MKIYLILIYLFVFVGYSHCQSEKLTKGDIYHNNTNRKDVFYNMLSNAWDSIVYENKVYSTELEDSVYIPLNRSIEIESSEDTMIWFYRAEGNKIILQSTGLKENVVFGNTFLYRNGEKSSCYFEDGIKQGIQIHIINGIKYFSFFQNGTKEGLELLVKNNALYLASYFKNGIKNGKEIKFCESRKLAIEISVDYVNGQLKNDSYIRYDCRSYPPSIFELVAFKDNQLFGLIPNFNNDSDLISISLHNMSKPVESISIN